MVSLVNAFAMPVGLWQLVAGSMMLVYRHGISWAVMAGYTAMYGDIQTSYGSFDRVSTYVALGVVALPACVLTLTWYHRYTGRTISRRSLALILGGWQMLVFLLLVLSYETGLPYRINQLHWKLLGPSADIYSFSNLVLPRIIAWLLCTVPVTWGALWVYTGGQGDPGEAAPR